MWRLAIALVVVCGLASSVGAPAAPPSQCADGRDNDRDGLVDARNDPGCTNRADSSERSPFTCNLGYANLTRFYLIRGNCSGPFGVLRVTAPQGTPFDRNVKPAVEYARSCRFVGARRLECAMADGAANPRHAVSARFAFVGTVTERPQVSFSDARERRLPWLQAEGSSGRGQGSASADLRMDVSGPQDFAPEDRYSPVDYVAYAIRIRNGGPDRSPGGTVSYTVEGAEHGKEIIVRGFYGVRSCNASLQTCELGPLNVHATAEITVNVPVAVPVVRVRATVEGQLPDPVKLSNTDFMRTEISNPNSVVEVAALVEPERAIRDRTTGVAVVRLGVSVDNKGPTQITRKGDAWIEFHSSVDLDVLPSDLARGECDAPAERAWSCAWPPRSSPHNVQLRLLVRETGPATIEVSARGVTINDTSAVRRTVRFEVVAPP
jgi:hypothetical protein